MSPPVRQFLQLAAGAFLMTLFALNLVGCGPKPAPSPAKPDPVSPLGFAMVETGPATFTAYTRTGPREELYEVAWKTATVTQASAARQYAVAKDVSGSLMKNGKPSSTFKADTGTIDRSAGVLTLQGHVALASVGALDKTKGLHLTCDTLHYLDSDQIVKSVGNVKVDGKDFTLGSFDEVWCRSDFSEIATPDLFGQFRHNSNLVKSSSKAARGGSS